MPDRQKEAGMKTAVVYYSKTGHSKKIANAIAASFGVQALDLKTSPTLAGVDMLYVVGGIYAGGNDPKMLAAIEKIDRSQVKKAVLITSCASRQMKQDKARQVLQQKGITVIADEYICQGSFLFMGKGHPNQAEVDQAVSFAQKMAVKVD